MNGIPILAIIVLAPVTGALLIALLGKAPWVPRTIALAAAAGARRGGRPAGLVGVQRPLPGHR